MAHGNDFTCLGVDACLDPYEQPMKQDFEITLKGRLGPESKDQTEMRVLNRIVTVQAAGLEHEPDPRLIELLAKGSWDRSRRQQLQGHAWGEAKI